MSHQNCTHGNTDPAPRLDRASKCARRAGAAAAAGQDRRVYKPGEDGVRLPAVDRQVRACYTEAARAARIQGRVLMEAVVEADGSVGEVQVTESLDKEHGLDQQAVDALKQWTLRPAMRDGKPVAARIVVDTYFTLR